MAGVCASSIWQRHEAHKTHTHKQANKQLAHGAADVVATVSDADAA